MKLVVKVNREVYNVSYVNVGLAHLEGDQHACGFKRTFDAALALQDNDRFTTVVLPFSLLHIIGMMQLVV